ncbi:hypothetical protein S83_032761 [Arachis hypogaea]
MTLKKNCTEEEKDDVEEIESKGTGASFFFFFPLSANVPSISLAFPSSITPTPPAVALLNCASAGALHHAAATPAIVSVASLPLKLATPCCSTTSPCSPPSLL